MYVCMYIYPKFHKEIEISKDTGKGFRESIVVSFLPRLVAF